ncbi:MAG: sigma-70 family RNA polymerase sigma factor [Nitrospirota bacterium]|nr:sigma-70 family RNA polymerase sigma factor [Nitrospirota bacterium]
MDETRHQEENDLIERTLKGDEDAYAVLVDRYKVLAYTLAFRMTGDADSANDIAQDSFIAAYEGLNRFRGTAKFSTWLATIVLNKCRDHGRARRETVDVDDIAELRGSSAPDPERIASSHETSEAVQHALDGLSPEYREVLILKHLEELGYEEIAAILGVSIAALKVRAHRARERLREVLDKQGVRP